MASRRVTFLIGANVQNFTRGLGKAQRQFRNFGRDMQRIGSTMSRSITLPIVALAGFAVKSAADFDAIRQGFIAITGSAEDTERQITRLRKIGRLPAVDFVQAAKSSMAFQAIGKSAAFAERMITGVANAVALSGGGAAEFSGVIRQFRQVASLGRLMGEEMNIILENAPAMAKAIQLAFGTTSTEAIRKLGLTSEEFFARMMEGMEALPQATGGAKNSLENMIQAVRGLARAVGNQLLPVVIPIVEKMTKVVDGLKNVNPEMIRFGLVVAGAAALIGPALFVMGKLFTAISVLASPAFLVGAAITTLFIGVVSTGQWFVDNWDKIAATFERQMLLMEQAATHAAVGIIEAIKGIINFATTLAPPELFARIFGLDLSEMAFDLIGVNKLLDDLRKNLDNNEKDMKGIVIRWSKDWTSFSDSAKNALELTKNTIINGLKGILNSSEIQSLIKQIENFFKFSPVASGGDTDSGGGGLSREADISGFANDYVKKLQSMKAATIEFSSVSKLALELAKSSWQDFKDALSEISDQVQSMIVQMFSRMATTLGANVGEALAGVKDQFATGFEQIILIFLDFAKQLASLLGVIGAALILSGVGVGAGAAMLAAAAVLSGIAAGFSAGINKRIANRREQNIPGMAHGGIIPPGFPNDTFPAFLSSGETVLPAPQALGEMRIHVTGELKGKGKEVVGVIRDAVYRMGR